MNLNQIVKGKWNIFLLGVNVDDDDDDEELWWERVRDDERWGRVVTGDLRLEMIGL